MYVVSNPGNNDINWELGVIKARSSVSLEGITEQIRNQVRLGNLTVTPAISVYTTTLLALQYGGGGTVNASGYIYAVSPYDTYVASDLATICQSINALIDRVSELQATLGR